MTLTTRAMSSKHEDFLAGLFQGRKTVNSGAGWADQMDGKQSHGSGEYVFSWDGKSTLGKSISITRDMWDKAMFQTQGWEIPVIPLRFYSNSRLTLVEHDLAVVDAAVLAALQADANEVVRLRNRLASLEDGYL